MQLHLVALLVGELLSLCVGIALLAIGFADMENDDYGLVLGFVGVFNGLALIACFAMYAIMLAKKQVFPKVVIGYSIGLCIICLQSIFVWSGFQTSLFANYTSKIFDIDKAVGKQLAECTTTSLCLDFQSGSFSLIDTLIADGEKEQDYSLEKAGAAVAITALLIQAIVIASAFVLLRKHAQSNLAGLNVSERESPTNLSAPDPTNNGYSPAPDRGPDKTLLANL